MRPTSMFSILRDAGAQFLGAAASASAAALLAGARAAWKRRPPRGGADIDTDE